MKKYLVSGNFETEIEAESEKEAISEAEAMLDADTFGLFAEEIGQESEENDV